MRIGTTPTHTFTLPFDVALIDELKLTYVQNGKTILEKYFNDFVVDEGKKQISYTLSQEETFLFTAGTNVELQVRVLTFGGDALASDVRIITAERCLDREVLE